MALELFVYKKVENILESFDLQKLNINIGQNIDFSLKINLIEQRKLRSEYAIFFLRKATNLLEKYFKLKIEYLKKVIIFFKSKV